MLTDREFTRDGMGDGQFHFSKINAAGRSCPANRSIELQRGASRTAVPANSRGVLFVCTGDLPPAGAAAITESFQRRGVPVHEVNIHDGLTLTALKGDVKKHAALRACPVVIGGYFGGVAVNFSTGAEKIYSSPELAATEVAGIIR